MAFNCSYDNATTNLTISAGTLVENVEVGTLVNAVNELKTYLNNSGGFNAGLTETVTWGLPTIIHHQVASSMRKLVDEIDPQTVCSCDYVCSSDNACACDTETSNCACESQTTCYPYCTCNSETNTCACEAESHCFPDCACNNVSTSCSCEAEYNCSPNCNCNSVYTT